MLLEIEDSKALRDETNHLGRFQVIKDHCVIIEFLICPENKWLEIVYSSESPGEL